jgi:hypothetical protein
MELRCQNALVQCWIYRTSKGGVCITQLPFHEKLDQELRSIFNIDVRWPVWLLMKWMRCYELPYSPLKFKFSFNLNRVRT